MQMHKHGGDIYSEPCKIDFSANINPFGMPQSVKKAACDGVEAAVSYPDISCRDLKKKLSEKIQMPKEYLIFGNGAAEVIFSVVHALKPAKTLVTAPGFAEYEHAVQVFGGAAESYLLEEKKEFQIGTAYLDRIGPDTDLVFLCNPNNPTGQLTEPELLEEILNRCRKYGTFVVLDECFNEFLDDPQRYTMLPKVREYDNLMILKAFTKIYAMPGLRLGYGVCSNEALIEKMGEIVQPWNISVPAQFAGAAALEEDAFVEQTRRWISEEKKWMRRQIEQMGMQVFGSKANYLFFKGPADLAQICKKQGMLIRDCSNYEGLQPGYYRAAVRRHEENEKLIACMEAAKNE